MELNEVELLLQFMKSGEKPKEGFWLNGDKYMVLRTLENETPALKNTGDRVFTVYAKRVSILPCNHSCWNIWGSLPFCCRMTNGLALPPQMGGGACVIKSHQTIVVGTFEEGLGQVIRANSWPLVYDVAI